VHDRQPDAGSRVVTTAIQYIGVPYLFGGFTPDAFDCSGFVQYVFARLGVDLPRTADYQFECGLPVAKSALRPGDVVFFTTYEPGASHDGIYVGDGMFIAATVSRGVAYCDLNDPFWTGCYLGARRYL
ncbi:MAG: C40 family peptidase, partial [Negativicutes bacterium]|nr:C40 family peptidase [Negativicutes bacterium]